MPQKSSWNFFAGSHGKGAVDGVGGTVKQDMCQCLSHDLKATINCTWLLV